MRERERKRERERGCTRKLDDKVDFAEAKAFDLEHFGIRARSAQARVLLDAITIGVVWSRPVWRFTGIVSNFVRERERGRERELRYWYYTILPIFRPKEHCDIRPSCLVSSKYHRLIETVYNTLYRVGENSEQNPRKRQLCPILCINLNSYNSWSRKHWHTFYFNFLATWSCNF